MRSVSEQPSAAGVADQLHGKISEKLAAAVWIRPVGRLSGHFTRVAAVSNCRLVEAPSSSASPETNAPVPCEPGAPAATFAHLARRACSMKARRTAFMRVW
jgi:hypothetical protein